MREKLLSFPPMFGFASVSHSKPCGLGLDLTLEETRQTLLHRWQIWILQF